MVAIYIFLHIFYIIAIGLTEGLKWLWYLYYVEAIHMILLLQF